VTPAAAWAAEDRMLRIDGEQALANRKLNPRRSWNGAASTDSPSGDPDDASSRIFGPFARIAPAYDGPRLGLTDPVFAMGSCFAREIETALIGRGGNVVSIDDRIDRPEFKDARGRQRTTFFHRYTPRSMLQEFQQCFEEAAGWSEDALLFRQAKSEAVSDLNYCSFEGADESDAAVRIRRGLARQLVRHAAKAKMVILTLGLIEAWRHKPSGLWANAPAPGVLARHARDFELVLLDVVDTVECLETIHDLLKRRHQDGDFQLVVTVSPVPMSATFTAQDIVVANAESKAVLRAAAGAFAADRQGVHYFPSYEMVTMTDPAEAWRPDRLHVNGKITRAIVKAFMAAYYRK
jgi:hypothetical protein